MSSLTDSEIWHKLQNHFIEVADLQMRDMFDDDPRRFDKFYLFFKYIQFD